MSKPINLPLSTLFLDPLFDLNHEDIEQIKKHLLYLLPGFPISPYLKKKPAELDKKENINKKARNNIKKMEQQEFNAMIKAVEEVEGITLTEEAVKQISFKLKNTAKLDIELIPEDILSGKEAVVAIEEAAVLMRDQLTPKLKQAKEKANAVEIRKFEDKIYYLQKETLNKIGIPFTFDESKFDHLKYLEYFVDLVPHGLRQTHLKHFSPKFFYQLKTFLSRKTPKEKLSLRIPSAPAGSSLF